MRTWGQSSSASAHLIHQSWDIPGVFSALASLAVLGAEVGDIDSITGRGEGCANVIKSIFFLRVLGGVRVRFQVRPGLSSSSRSQRHSLITSRGCFMLFPKLARFVASQNAPKMEALTYTLDT